MPACPAGSVQQQVMQQYSYLFQMAQQLNLALERLEQGTGASSGGKGTEQQYRKLRSLITGGEERLKRAVEELAAQVETEYVAADSFDGQAAALSVRLEAEPEKLGAYYGFAATLRNGLAAVADAFDRYRENAAACVRTVRQLLPPVSPVTLHLHSGGRGAAFGKRSTGEALECAWPAVFYGDVEVSGGLTLGGQALADALWPVGCVRLTAEDTEPQPSPEGAEWERVDCGMAGIYAWRRIT